MRGTYSDRSAWCPPPLCVKPQNITSTFGALTATTLNIIPPPSLPPPVTSAGAAAAAATSAAQTALSNGAGAAADAVQQLSAAVLRSGAFQSAIATLDEWKARMGAAPGEQAEVAVRRQAEVVRAWLQEVSNTAAAAAAVAAASGHARATPEDTRPRPLFPPPPGSPPHDAAASGAPAGGPASGAAGGGGSILHVADPDSLAERLRISVESAMTSLMAAASAGRDRFVASANASVSSLPSLPSMPSLPAAHELPLVEPAALAAGRAGARAADGLGQEAGRSAAERELAAAAEADAAATVTASVAGVSGPAEEKVLAAALSKSPQVGWPAAFWACYVESCCQVLRVPACRILLLPCKLSCRTCRCCCRPAASCTSGRCCRKTPRRLLQQR